MRISNLPSRIQHHTIFGIVSRLGHHLLPYKYEEFVRGNAVVADFLIHLVDSNSLLQNPYIVLYQGLD